MRTNARILLLIVIGATRVSAQVSTGVPLFSSIGGGPFDSVNLGNLNVHFTIPILNKAGRGVPFYYDLSYDSSIWTPVTSNGVTQWQPANGWGWTAQTAATSGYVSAAYTTSTTTDPECSPAGTTTTQTWSDYTYHDPLGRSHPFPGNTWIAITWCNNRQSSQNSGPLKSTATDGSGLALNSGGAGTSNWTITTATGQVINGPWQSQNGVGTYTDANGNQVTVNSSGQYFDTLSSTTPVMTMAGSGTPASPTTFQYSAPTGAGTYGSETYTVSYVQYTVATNFGFTSSPQIKEYGRTSVALVDHITLPDNSEYTFTYEKTTGSCSPLANTYSVNCVTGRIIEVTLPTGGSITYSYTGGTQNTGIFSDGSTAGLSRALNPGGTWTYARAPVNGAPGPGSTWTTTISDALSQSNTTVINFAEDSAINGTSTAATYNLYETQRQVYQGASSPANLLATIVRCYGGNFANCSTATVTSPIGRIDTYTVLPNGETRLSDVFYNGSYPGSGFVSEDNEYDFGVAQGSAPGTTHLLTETDISYASLGNGIVGKPSAINVYDWSSGSKAQIASTTYTYDQSGTLYPTSGTLQHISITGSRGNLTSATYQTSSSSSLSQSFTYYDTGNVYTATDVNAAVTTYGYGSNSCGNSFADSVSEPLSLSRSMTWDCTAGVETGVTDENSNPFSYKFYDPFIRIKEVDNPDGGKTTYSYTATQTSIYAYQKSSTYTDTELLADGFGRPSRGAVSNGQSSNPWYQTDDCYDADGNLSFLPYPYQGAGWGTQQCSTAGDTVSYDALGRVTQVKHSDNTTQTWTYTGRATQFTDEKGVTRITQVDGLGRPTISCEVTSTSLLNGTEVPSSCGTDITPNTGFSTTYSYSVVSGLNQTTIAQGGQTRTFQTDWLGRPTSTTEPESGTTTYSYAYNSTGLVVTRIRPQANQTGTSTTTTTTQYDSLGRPVSIAYTDGTLSKTFMYDVSSVWGVTLQNPKGRLVNVHTGNTAGDTGSIFSYDTMGRPTLIGECTPSNCGNGNFTVTAAYDWEGNITQYTDAFGPVYTYSYTPANELSSITTNWNDSNHPPNLLSNVTFGPFGPLNWKLGNGLTGVRSYDSLGRVSGGWLCNGSTQPNCSGSLYSFTSGWTGTYLTSASDSVLNRNDTYSYDAFGPDWMRKATATMISLSVSTAEAGAATVRESSATQEATGPAVGAAEVAEVAAAVTEAPQTS